MAHIEEEPLPQARLNRRGFLFLLLAAAGSLCLGVLSRITTRFLHRPVPRNSYGTTVPVGPVNELPLADSPPALILHGRFWLVHGQDGLVALYNGCTHLECLVSWDMDRQQFLCPCHGSAFTRNGQVLRGPATRPLDRFPVKLTGPDGEVIRESTDTGAPMPIADLLDAQNAENVSEPEILPAQAIMVVVDTARKIRAT